MKNVKLFKEFLWDKQGWGFRIMISWFFVVVLVFGAVLDWLSWCRKRWDG